MNQVSFPSFWLQGRLERAAKRLHAQDTILVSVPPCAFPVEAPARLAGRRVVLAPSQQRWSNLTDQSNLSKDPKWIIAPHPWWLTYPAPRTPSQDKKSWLEGARLTLSRCTDDELEVFRKATRAESQSGSPSLSQIRWATGGWPGLAWAWLQGAPVEEDGVDAEGSRFTAMQTRFAQTWQIVIDDEKLALAGVARLPWLHEDLLNSVFNLSPAAQRLLLDAEVLLLSPSSQGKFELDPTLERLLVATTSVPKQALADAAAWFFNHGDTREAVNCSLASNSPISSVVAALLRMESERLSRQKCTSALSEMASSASIGEERLGVSLATTPDSFEINETLSSLQLLYSLASELVILDAEEVDLSFIKRIRSFSGAAREPLRKSNSAQPNSFPVGRQSQAAALALKQDPLNHREAQILTKICSGLSNSDIARELGIQISTVKWYATSVYAKLGVKNRTQAVVRAQELGLAE